MQDSPLQNIGVYVKNAILMSSMLLEMSIFNYMGSVLIQSNNHLKNSLFEMNWTEKDVKFKKLMLMFQQRTQKFIETRIGYIFVVDLGIVRQVNRKLFDLNIEFVLQKDFLLDLQHSVQTLRRFDES